MAVKLPLFPFEKILKESDPNIRVSETAAREFVLVIGEMANDMAEDAAELARHANRRTILASDIKMAAKRKR
ncbi:MAG: histone [Candidatus Aenigmarchaeota archaeon]